ncbi:MAG TPA: putative sugar O-methyltransferase [Gemmataceae bacterium]|nr:putative sugar O-methyltransferase [Gemmataceae bacterium]
MYAGFRHICEGDHATVSCLRLYCQHFTGFRLASMEFAEGKPFPTPEEVRRLDGWLATIAATPNFAVERYRRIAEQLPPELRIDPPRAFGEIGWLVGNRIVSSDTCVYQERMAILHETGILRELKERQRVRGASGQPLRIVEIGGGYGGLAYHLKKYLPGVQYFIVDIPESLVFASIYLSVLFKNEKNVCLLFEDKPRSLQQRRPGFTFVPNFLFDKVAASDVKFDLALNTLSMSEMGSEQVRYYCEGIKKLLAPDGVFFEQNQDNQHLGKLDARTIITEHFPHKIELESKLSPGLMTQGRAHIWSNNPVDFSPASGARAA